MAYLSELACIGINTEATQNTAAACDATDFTYAKDVEINPITEFLPREYKRSTLDQLKSVLGQFYVEVSFKLAVRGSGTAGTALAPLGAVLQAAGMSETVSGGVSVTYAPISAPGSANFFSLGKSATVEVYLGATTSAIKHQVKGCVTSALKMSNAAGKINWYDCKMVGIYVAVTTASMPTQTYNTTVEPIWQSSSLSMISYSAIVRTLEIDFGLEYEAREDSASAYGVGGFQVTGRKPKGKVSFESAVQSSEDTIAKMAAATEGVLSFVCGATAGNITTVSLPKAQYVGMKYNRGSKILLTDADLQFNQSTGDDWISIVLT